MPVKKAGEILGETDSRLWRMLFLHVRAAHAASEWEVVWVGADEMSIRKGHNDLTVFADLRHKQVIDATEGKGAETWESFVAEMEAPHAHSKQVTQAAIDMSPAYLKGVKENLGNAEIVFDKFHVVAQGNGGVDKVRRAEAQASEAARCAAVVSIPHRPLLRLGGVVRDFLRIERGRRRCLAESGARRAAGPSASRRDGASARKDTKPGCSRDSSAGALPCPAAWRATD